MPAISGPKAAQAGVGPQTASGQTFDFTKFAGDLAEQNKLQAERQAEQVRVSQANTDIMQRSATLAQEQFKSIQFLKTDVDISRQKATHARELADSNNPMDTLRLMGLQTMDPNGYIRKNREARLQEDAGQAAILSQFYSQGQSALQAELATTTGRLDTLKTLEAIGREKLTNYADSAALMHQNLSAVQTMKEDAIHDLSDQNLSGAIQQAKASPNGMTNVGGIDVDIRTLEDRQQALTERSYHQTVQSTLMELAKDDASHVPETLAARDLERKQNKEAIDNYPVDKQIRDSERGLRLGQLIDQTNGRILRTMSMKELQDIRGNNYQSAAGIRYNPTDVEGIYTTKKGAETQQIEDAVNQNLLKNFDTQQLSTEQKRVDGMITRFPEGTPIAAAAREYRTALGITANGVGPENGPISRISAMNTYNLARDKFDKVLQAQATLDGKGDKDLVDLRLEYYRGNPVPQESLTNAATKRLNAFKSVGDLFPPEMATKVESKYREVLQQKMQRGPMDYGSMTESDKQLAKDAAAQEAINFGVQQGLAGQTDVISSQQVADPSHPLYRLMTPQTFGTYQGQADARAYEAWKQANELTDDQAGLIMGGQQIPGKPDSAQLRAQRQFMENQQLLQTLDGVQPGLGHEVADWWQTKGADYIGNVSNGITSQSSKTFQGNNFVSQAGTTVAQSYNEYAMGLAAADSQFQKQMIQRNTDLLTFGSTPGRAQIAILDADKSISESDKKRIYTQIIHPILEQAQKRGLDYTQSNQFIEESLQQFVPQDPGMKELMLIVKKDRPAILEQMNSWSSTFSRFLPNTGKSLDGIDSQWYQAYLKDSGQLPAYKPWLKMGPIQIGGNVDAYERMLAERKLASEGKK